MDRVAGVVPVLVRVTEVREIRREGVGVEENCMVRVNRANRGVHLVVECDQSCVLRVGRLIERVVSCDPLVIFVVLRELGPQPEDTVLEIFVIPN